jgi:hypothetical protein
MGQIISIPHNHGIDISSLPDFANETFTVTRSSGLLDPGWGPCKYYIENNGSHTEFKTIVAAKYKVRQDEEPVWRVLMNNKKEDAEVLFGWRKLSTIWPSCLDGNDELIKKWQTEMEAKLEPLYAAHYA